jgi:predicted phosphodiesterase
MPSWITPEKRAAIDDLIEKGFKTNSIVRMLDTTKETVRGRRFKLGMPNDRPQAQPDQFTTYESIASTGYNGVNTPTVKPRVRVRASSVPIGTNTAYDPGSDGGIVPSGNVTRVVVVADTHTNPNLQNHRASHIGKFVADHAPDYLVHLGDWADWEFASRFEDWSSLHGRERSPFKDELDDFVSFVERLSTPIAHMSKPPKLVTTLGNHDERVWLFENTHPEMEGMMWAELEAALGDWKIYPFKQYAFVGGVGFTHVPINKMGKPYGGRTSANQIANDASFSIVYGHTHEQHYINRPKLGPSNAVSIFNCPAALPQGYVKPYAMLATTGWSYGVSTLEISDGRILSHAVTSMELLERRYGGSL